MTATLGDQARARPRRSLPALAATVLIGVGMWLAASRWLLPTSVPSSLRLAHLDPTHFFSRAFLARSASYERFLDIDALLAELTLLAVLCVYALRLATWRRGGMGRPEAVPVALLVLVALTLVLAPLRNALSRRVESEADWVGLNATHDPAAARGLLRRLATTSLSDPNPPAWSYVLEADHPTIMQRLAMADAWESRSRRP